MRRKRRCPPKTTKVSTPRRVSVLPPRGRGEAGAPLDGRRDCGRRGCGGGEAPALSCADRCCTRLRPMTTRGVRCGPTKIEWYRSMSSSYSSQLQTSNDALQDATRRRRETRARAARPPSSSRRRRRGQEALRDIRNTALRCSSGRKWAKWMGALNPNAGAVHIPRPRRSLHGGAGQGHDWRSPRCS